MTGEQQHTAPSATVRVWDLPVRVFHWGLVLLVGIAMWIGYSAPEWWMGVHTWAGYGIVVLLVFRLIWGVFGSEYSRIAHWTHTPQQIREHVRGLLLLRPLHYLGHNPTGALMMLALMGVLGGLVVTGLLALGGEEKQGPLAGVVRYSTGNAAKAVHAGLAGALLVMITGHTIGAVGESILMRENLILAMITGRKRLPEGSPVPLPRRARPLATLLSVGVFAGLGGGALAILHSLPPLGWRPLLVPAVYTQECGSCHWAYHPSLLPAASWRGLMQQLADHFGEDASLAEDVATMITAFLTVHASETWDTEAANRFRVVAVEAPWQISATPAWIRMHQEIPPAVFGRQGVGSKSACQACHLDADSGRFDDQRITIPKE